MAAFVGKIGDVERRVGLTMNSFTGPEDANA